MIEYYTLSLVAFVLVSLNILTFGIWSLDKRNARLQERRVPEATLLLLAALGGMPTAKIAQRRLRHKSRKQPFGRRLNTIAGVQVVLLVCLAIPVIRHAGVELISRVVTSLTG